MSVVHHMPGRLRLKFPELKNHSELASAVTRSIRQLDGVKLVQANAITGSLLIHYEAHGGKQHALLSAIDTINRGLGLERDSAAFDGIVASAAPANPLVDRFINMVIDKALERSAFALLGVLL